MEIIENVSTLFWNRHKVIIFFCVYIVWSMASNSSQNVNNCLQVWCEKAAVFIWNWKTIVMTSTTAIMRNEEHNVSQWKRKPWQCSKKKGAHTHTEWKKEISRTCSFVLNTLCCGSCGGEGWLSLYIYGDKNRKTNLCLSICMDVNKCVRQEDWLTEWETKELCFFWLAMVE